MKPAARLQDNQQCPSTIGPIEKPGAVTVSIDAKIASKLADHILCPAHPEDVVMEGAATVLWEQLPATIETSATTASGVVIPPCSPTVFIGGPTFKVPANILVHGTQDERNKIVRDLYLLWTTPSGRELLRRLAETGKTISIYPTPETGDASSVPFFWPALAFGYGTSSTVYYNPDGQIATYDRNGQPISTPPQVVLGHELTHSLDEAEGTMSLLGTNPNGPASQPDIRLAESRAIGTGSHHNTSPSENSIRRDLGLPERDNHYGDTSIPGNGPQNLRPGK